MAQTSIIRIGNVDASNWGAEFYHPEKIRATERLSKYHNKVSDRFHLVKGMQSSFDTGAKFVNLDDVQNGFVDSISKDEALSAKRLAKEGDVMISNLTSPFSITTLFG